MKDRRAKAILVAIGILGVALFFGDGTVTPAISVISSVEGLKTAMPGVTSLVVPITVALLTLLFAYQQFGTHAIGRLFGPIMAVWFALLAVTGVAKVAQSPEILKALSPTYGIAFFADHPAVGFLSLGAVVLVVTGAEALYADLGQFNRPSIRRAWFFVVFPALLINYLGQGALILADPKAVATPFFGLLPNWAQVPMVVVAVLATMIASQAVITGAFSVTRQGVQMGFLPRMQIHHKSGSEGQVYVPATNWLLYVAVIGLVIGFGSSTKLASAYGIAVTGTFVTTTLLFFAIVRMRWQKPLWIVLPGSGGVPRHRPELLLGEPDQGPLRRLVPAHRWAADLHRPDHLAARPEARHGQALAGRGVTERFRRQDQSDGPAAVPPAGHGHLPLPQRAHDPAGPARQPPLQPRRCTSTSLSCPSGPGPSPTSTRPSRSSSMTWTTPTTTSST